MVGLRTGRRVRGLETLPKLSHVSPKRNVQSSVVNAYTCRRAFERQPELTRGCGVAWSGSLFGLLKTLKSRLGMGVELAARRVLHT